MTSDRLAFVTIGSQPASGEVVMLRELLIVVPDDAVAPETEFDELAP